ncbi:hypothetical protein SBA4_4350014 [Candidatus Sulfopaludibacter sp. SbA4]|nr:hypothetical protein SBA4_4350014 [Candidatus Sulfopaludibacter sp. SbA4]
MTARFDANPKPLANARGSERSHDRKGVAFRQVHNITRSKT